MAKKQELLSKQRAVCGVQKNESLKAKKCKKSCTSIRAHMTSPTIIVQNSMGSITRGRSLARSLCYPSAKRQNAPPLAQLTVNTQLTLYNPNHSTRFILSL